MLWNYLKSAFRNLKKTKLFSFINIGGLAISVTAFIFIMQYVHFEKSYDRFILNADRIYRLRYERTDSNGDAVRFASCCPPAAARIRDRYPEVEKIGRMFRYEAVVSVANIHFLEAKMFFMEPELVDLFDIDIIKGNPEGALANPNTALMSLSTARKYFGAEDPVGKTFTVDNKTDYRIIGLFPDARHDSHLKFDILLPWKTLESQFGPDYYEAWGHTGAYTYLAATPGIDAQAFEKKLLPLIAAECPWLKEYNMKIDLKMQPLTEIHLSSHYMQELETNGDGTSVDVLMIIAVFIIIMAWVNYVNLSTARFLSRAREVGLRKVVGASRRQLVLQFFFETGMINIIAMAIALVLMKAFLPAFRHISGVPVDYGMWTHGWFWLTLLVVLITGVFLSGFYPVAVLSSYRPMAVLRGKLGQSSKGLSLRKILVTFQFTVALILLTATIAVYEQISFLRSRNPGFNLTQTLVVKAPRVRDAAYPAKFESFKTTLLGRAGIERISHVTEVPGRQIYWDNGGIMRLGEDVAQSKNYQIVGIDYDFAGLFDLKLAAGRNFSREFPADKDALIFNETAVRWMGFPDAASALGQQVDYWDHIYTIVGVFKDYHQQSPKVGFEPHIYRLLPYGRDVRGMIAIKLNVQDVTGILDDVKERYGQFFSGNPFDFFFLDDYYDQQYKSDRQFGQVFFMFSLLAILITALGIFGLSSATTLQRTKEIGIRKAVGASVADILFLLSKDVLRLLVLAFALTVLPALWALNRWLNTFAHRMNPNAWLFLMALAIVLFVTLWAISGHVVRAARANPVQSLRYE